MVDQRILQWITSNNLKFSVIISYKFYYLMSDCLYLSKWKHLLVPLVCCATFQGHIFRVVSIEWSVFRPICFGGYDFRRSMFRGMILGRSVFRGMFLGRSVFRGMFFRVVSD